MHCFQDSMNHRKREAAKANMSHHGNSCSNSQVLRLHSLIQNEC